MRRLSQEEMETWEMHPDIRTPRGVHNNTISRGKRRVAKTRTCYCLIFSRCACSGYKIKRTKATQREQKGTQASCCSDRCNRTPRKGSSVCPMKMGALMGTICWWHILLLPFPGGRGPVLPPSPCTYSGV